MKNKAFAVIVCLVLVAAMAIPGTLALSTDQTSSNDTIEVPTETTTPAPDTTETPVPEGTEAPAETPTEEPVKTCTCDPKPAEGEAHKEGCPLYVAPEQPAEAEKTCTCDPQPAEGEAHKEGCPLYVAPEQPAEEEKVCTCDPKPAEGEAHREGCPLYVEPDAPLYDRLMAAETLEAFTTIVEQADEKELSDFTCEEFDNVEAHYVFLSTGEYPDNSPVVDEALEIVNFTNVAPLVGAGD